jgi:ubiquinone/menaquinone biosynthesis C-methylase UbiE
MKTTELKKKKVDTKELENKVKGMYRNVAINPHIEYHFEMGRALAERLGYPRLALDRIPESSIASFAGVGFFFDLLNLQIGDNVVDLGSGSGMDVFYAANAVGIQGNVVGIDMTTEQLTKSRQLKLEANYKNAYFKNAYIEELPVQTASADAVISNGVINLSGNKAKVFKEAARVLKQGGKLALADIVTTKKLPESITCNATLWAACIGGAMQVNEYQYLIEEAGFTIEIVKKNPYEFLSNSAKGATGDYGIMSLSLLAVKNKH